MMPSGDLRWTADMITGTWIMAETGYPPERSDLEYNTGNSGGGFDKLRFKFPETPPEEQMEPKFPWRYLLTAETMDAMKSLFPCLCTVVECHSDR
jgi:hypothetical protein